MELSWLGSSRCPRGPNWSKSVYAINLLHINAPTTLATFAAEPAPTPALRQSLSPVPRQEP